MKKNSFSFVAAMVTLALAGGASTATGCGGVSVSSLCKDICACQGCTTNDLESCETEGETAADQADTAGCGSQFEDLIDCSSTHVTCKSNRARFEGCEAEQTALLKSSSAIGGLGKTDCERAADSVSAKFTGCGGTVTPTSSSSGSPAECTDQLGTISLCQAACLEAADCSLLVADDKNPPTSEQVQAFSDCITLCK